MNQFAIMKEEESENMSNNKEWKFSMDDFLKDMARKQNRVYITKEEVQEAEAKKKENELKNKKD